MIQLFRAPLPLQWFTVAILSFAIEMSWLYLAPKHFILFTFINLFFWMQYKYNAWLAPRIELKLSSDYTATRVRSDSANAAAPLAMLAMDPFLLPMGRFLLAPVKASLMTLIVASSLHSAWKALLIVLTILTARRVGRQLAHQELEGGQLRRDREAAKILALAKTGEPPRNKFFLYLRPFKITGQLWAEDPKELQVAVKRHHATKLLSEKGEEVGVQIPILLLELPIIGEGFGLFEMNPEWEVVFESAFRGFGKFIAFGRPGESFGSGRIEVQEGDWRDEIKVLASRASGFLVVPSANPGTLWELRWLGTHRSFRNCIFLMPPEVSQTPSWEDLRETLSSTMKLPRHPGVPSLFCYDSQHRVHLAFVASQVVRHVGGVHFHINRQSVYGALTRLLPIANWEMEGEMDAPAQKARELIEVLVRNICLHKMDLTDWSEADNNPQTRRLFDLLGQLESLHGPEDFLYLANGFANLRLESKSSAGNVIANVLLQKRQDGEWEPQGFSLLDPTDELQAREFALTLIPGNSIGGSSRTIFRGEVTLPH